MCPAEATNDGVCQFTLVDRAPVDVIEMTIETSFGTWSVDQIQLEARAITGLGEVLLE